MHRIRWIAIGVIATLVWQRYQSTGRMGWKLQPLLVELRRWLADMLDNRGHRLGQMVEGRTHAWSERLRTNGKAKRIPIEGTD